MTSKAILICVIFPFVISTLLFIVYFCQRKSPWTTESPVNEKVDAKVEIDENLVAILQMEFEYISKTASEAMSDRHTMVNFFLVITTLITTGVAGIVNSKDNLPIDFAIILLWASSLIGLFYFLKIIRLRQAWVESAKAMNCIKQALIDASDDKQSKFLNNAFMWKSETIPKPQQKYNVFHYSAMFIGMINTYFYIAGAYLLCQKYGHVDPSPFSLSYDELFYFAVGFVAMTFIYGGFYSKFLTEPVKPSQ